MQQSHPSTHGHRSRPYLRASMKPSSLGMQLMLHRSLHTSASHQDCTDRAREEWWKEKASVRRSSPSQESSSLMDGECSHPSKSLPTCLKPKMCRTEARPLARPALKPKIRMMPDSRKKRRETYLRQHTGTKQKMAPTRGGRPSERASTSKC